MSFEKKIGCLILSFVLYAGCIIPCRNVICQTVPDPNKVLKGKVDTLPYKIISKGGDAGEYQAVPDACHLNNGDIIVVFYDGNNHVTFPGADYPKAGRICMVRSKDEGRTWTRPVIIYDDIYDNRDPHVNQLSDGSLICSFFSLKFDLPDSVKLIKKEHLFSKEQIAKFGNNPDLLKEQRPLNDKEKTRQTDPAARKWSGTGPFVIKSFDNGINWEKEAKQIATLTPNWYCSAKVREMPDSTVLLPVYHSETSRPAAWGGVIPSYDKGKTWGTVVPIGQEANLILAAETDVVLLNDKTLFAALRGDGSKVNMHYATSSDLGKSWTPVKDIGFVGHCPSFTKLKTGEILLSYRAFSNVKGYFTGIRISRDEAKTWEGPYLVDEKVGGYPSTIELKDGSILIIYYEEGEKSSIRALRFRMPEKTYGEKFYEPKPIEKLTLK
ncbi:MAG: glycoside hydrolase [Bacteroidales bacterium]|nr:glycoside hydrolase [Bacteroidales bacterium]